MRIARDLGEVSVLLPEGIEDLKDVPHPMFDAIRTGLVYLSFEELPKDERPPRTMWRDGEKLSAWFAEVERKRHQKYGTTPTDDPGEGKRNDAARFLISE